MAVVYRPLTRDEIKQLKDQGSSCADWSQLSVTLDFQPQHIRACHFVGRIEIGSGAVLENVDEIAAIGLSSFGNGVEVAVVNEAGGREVALYEELSAPIAYILAFCRHRPQLISALQTLIQTEVTQQQGDTVRIGTQTVIRHCGVIRNTHIGPYARLEGVQCLENGTVKSHADLPTTVGMGVIARNFILAEGAEVTDHSLLSKCFVGQGCRLKQLTAENCLFFANSEAFFGEVCSVFAGPHTVTHHKGTLLIACYTSFFNAGSHTNQSNHMYRLGPNHQGILERGCKTGSGAYLCWPSYIGAFNFVKGRHYSNPDTSNLPFSYLIEQNEHTRVHPGAVLGSIGLVRDSHKWPLRDQRPPSLARDPLVYDWLNPMTVEKILSGIQILEKLTAQPPTTPGHPLRYQRLTLTLGATERGLFLYRSSVHLFLGQSLLRQLENKAFNNWAELMTCLAPETTSATGPWLDLAGLLAPAKEVESLISAIESGKSEDLTTVQHQFQQLADQYISYCWSWAVGLWLSQLQKTFDQVNSQDVIQLLQTYQAANHDLFDAAQQDAQHEFNSLSQISYGRDGSEQTQAIDFAAIRGNLHTNNFLQTYEDLVKHHSQQTEALISRIQGLSQHP